MPRCSPAVAGVPIWISLPVTSAVALLVTQWLARGLIAPLSAMTDAAPLKPLKIDFVSDVMCPWCAVGLGGLEQALERLQGEGVIQEIKGKGQKAVGDAKQATKDAVNNTAAATNKNL